MDNQSDRIVKWSSLHTCRRCQGKVMLGDEQVPHPSTHCVCPGSPVWQRLEARPIGTHMRLRQARMAWEGANRPRMVYYFRDGVRCEMDLNTWRGFLKKNWDALLEFNPEIAQAS